MWLSMVSQAGTDEADTCLGPSVLLYQVLPQHSLCQASAACVLPIYKGIVGTLKITALLNPVQHHYACIARKRQWQVLSSTLHPKHWCYQKKYTIKKWLCLLLYFKFTTLSKTIRQHSHFIIIDKGRVSPVPSSEDSVRCFCRSV